MTPWSIFNGPAYKSTTEQKRQNSGPPPPSSNSNPATHLGLLEVLFAKSPQNQEGESSKGWFRGGEVARMMKAMMTELMECLIVCLYMLDGLKKRESEEN